MMVGEAGAARVGVQRIPVRLQSERSPLYLPLYHTPRSQL
jgi:hypothetical protein